MTDQVKMALCLTLYAVYVAVLVTFFIVMIGVWK